MTDARNHDIPDDLPPVVTFRTGAELLVRLGIVPNMTSEGVRRIARRYDKWPFGEGKPHPYVQVGNAQAMATGPFLDFFRHVYTYRGRGPDRVPGSRQSRKPS